MTDAFGTTVEIATQAIEALGAIASGIQNMRILDLSKDYYKLYKEQKDFYYATMQPIQGMLNAEALGEPIYNANYAGRVNTAYNSVTGPFGGSSTDAYGWWKRKSNMYGTAPDPMITALPADLARIKSDWTNYLFRVEEHYATQKQDTRWDRRMMVHNIAIKQGAEVSGTLNASLSNFQNHIQDLGNVLATYGNGIARYAGYRKGLQDVSDAIYSGTVFRPPSVGDYNAYHKEGALA